jgi:hypothetical protein
MMKRLLFLLMLTALPVNAFAACAGPSGVPFNCDTEIGALSLTDLIMGGQIASSRSVRFTVAQVAQATWTDPPSWGDVTRPSGPNLYETGYNTTRSQFEYWNGTSWIQFLQSTLPSAQILVGNGSGVATNVSLSGDCTLSNAGAITCTKTSGSAFTSAATTSIGTSGAVLGLLNANKTDSGSNQYTGGIEFGSATGGVPSAGSINVAGSLLQNNTPAVREHVSFAPGTVTSISNTKGGFSKFSYAATVDNIEASALAFTCSGNPVVTLYECGASSTCASPTTIGSATVTASGQVFDGSISAGTITAGDYIAWALSSGTCTSLDLIATAQIHSN